jgi:cell cycle related kinase
MDQYKVVGRIGEGAHGLVLRGQRLSNGQEVALKRVLLKKLEDGIPTTVIREIKALQEIDCEYVRTATNCVIINSFVPVCSSVLYIRQ